MRKPTRFKKVRRVYDLAELMDREYIMIDSLIDKLQWLKIDGFTNIEHNLVYTEDGEIDIEFEAYKFTEETDEEFEFRMNEYHKQNQAHDENDSNDEQKRIKDFETFNRLKREYGFE